MSSRRITTEIKTPFKGLFAGCNADNNPVFFSVCRNVLFDKSGCITKRPGFSLDDTAPVILGAVSVDGMHVYVKQGTTGHPLTRTIFHCGGNIYSVPNAYYLKNSVPIKTNMTAGKQIESAILSDKCYMANGSEVLQEYGTAKCGNIVQTGTGLNDISILGIPVSTEEVSVVIVIDSTGATDTFKYSLDGGSTYVSELIPITGTAQSIGYGVSVKFSAVTGHTLNDEFTFILYPENSITDILTPPESGLNGSFTPSLLTVHRNSLWAAGVPGNPSRLYKSVPLIGRDFNTNLATFDPEDGYALEGAAQIDIRPDDGTGIVGLAGDHFGQLIVFKGNSIHRLLGATKADFILPPDGIIDGIETIKGSLIRANNDIYFASKKGIHKLSTVQQFGDNQESFLSLPVQEFYKSLDKFSINTRCQGIHWPDISCLLWTFTSEGKDKNDILLVYNYAVETWSVWDNINVKSMMLAKYIGTNTIFIGDYASRIGRSDFVKRNDFNGSFTWNIEFKLSLGDSHLWKGWRDYSIGYNVMGDDIDVKTKVDNTAWSSTKKITPVSYDAVLDKFILDTDLLATDTAMDSEIVEINQHGKVLTINLQNTNKNEKVEIQNIMVQSVPEGYYGNQLRIAREKEEEEEEGGGGGGGGEGGDTTVRLYLHSGLTPPVSPVYAEEWDDIIHTARGVCSNTKELTPFETKSIQLDVSPPGTILFNQYISPPLIAQTISGTVKGQLLCGEFNSDADFCRSIVIKVVSNDGLTVRGTLLSHFPALLVSEFEEDIKNWQIGILEGSDSWYSVIWCPDLGIFVATANVDGPDYAKTCYSADGVNWTPGNIELSFDCEGLVWCPELEILVITTTNGVFTSVDGINGTLHSTGVDIQLYDVTWSPDLEIFIAVGYGYDQVILKSVDGSSWTGVFSQNEFYEDYNGVIWISELGLFVTVGSGIRISADGNSWNQTLNLYSEEVPWETLYNVAWSPELGMIVAVGTSDGIISQGLIYTSSNGITWSRTLFGTPCYDVTWISELGVFILTGGYSLKFSPDGISWYDVPGYNPSVYVVGSTWSKTLQRFVATGTEDKTFLTFDGQLVNRKFPPLGTVLASVECQEGDRLVIEIGAKSLNSTETHYTASQRFGDAVEDDLPENETSTDDYCPWIEFHGSGLTFI